MEDINNALLHIKAKHNGEIPYQYGSRECAKLMDSYAKEYHDHQLKLLSIADVMAMLPQVTLLEKVNRVEVIDQNGRSYVNWKPTNKTEISFQDNGSTLKVFVSN